MSSHNSLANRLQFEFHSYGADTDGCVQEKVAKWAVESSHCFSNRYQWAVVQDRTEVCTWLFSGMFSGHMQEVWSTSLCFAPSGHLTLRVHPVQHLTGHDVDPGAKPSAERSSCRQRRHFVLFCPSVSVSHAKVKCSRSFAHPRRTVQNVESVQTRNMNVLHMHKCGTVECID